LYAYSPRIKIGADAKHLLAVLHDYTPRNEIGADAKHLKKEKKRGFLYDAN
jgi:hypothetical protein